MADRISQKEWASKNPPRKGESFDDYVRRYEDDTAPGLIQQAAETAGQFARGGAVGLAKTGTSLVGGLGELVGSSGLRKFARETERQAEEFYSPEGTAGAAGEFIGRGLGEIATSIGAGGAIAKGLSAARGGSRVARAARAIGQGVEQGGAMRRALSNVAVNAPIDVLQGAYAKEGLVADSPAGAILENMALSGAGGALSGIVDARRAAAAERARKPITDPRRMLPAAGQTVEYSGAPVPPLRAGRGLPQVQQAGPVQDVPLPTMPLSAERRGVAVAPFRQGPATPVVGAREAGEEVAQDVVALRQQLSGMNEQDLQRWVAMNMPDASEEEILQMMTEMLPVREGRRGLGSMPLQEEEARRLRGVRNPKMTARRRSGAAEAQLLESIAGGGLGAAVGYGSGETDEERLARALAGGAAGAFLPAGIRRGARFFERGAAPAAGAATPQAMREAQIDIAQQLRPGDIKPPRLDQTATKFPTNREPLVRRMNVPFEQRQRIEELVTQIEPTLSGPMNRQTFYRDVGKILGEKDVGQLLDIDPKRATAAEAGAVLSISKDMSKQRQSILDRIKSTIDADEKAILINDLDALDDAQARLVSHVVKMDRAAGQSLASRRYVAKEITDPTYWYIRGNRVKGGGLLTPDEMATIDKLTATKDTEGLLKYMASLQKSSTLEQVAQLRAAGLLTAIPGRLRDILSTGTNYVATTLQRYPGVLADVVASNLAARKLGGRAEEFRSVLAPSKSEMNAAFAGVREGWQQAARSMGYDAAKAGGFEGWVRAIREAEIDENMARQLDIPSLINIDMFGQSKLGQKANVFFDTYSKLAMRGSGVTDKVMKAAALRGSLDEQARLIAKRRGLKGAEADKTVQELLADPTEDMLLNAKMAADYATFTNDGTLSEAISGAISLASGVAERSLGKGALVRAASRFLMPFRRTPANILSRALEYAPGTGQLAAANAAWDWTKELSKAALAGSGSTASVLAKQRRAVDIFGRQLTGLGAFGLGTYLYKQGILTGELPTEPAEQEQWRLEGKQPEAMKIGDSWVPISRISPFGGMLTMAASMMQNAEKAGEQGALDTALSGGLTVTRSLLNQPMVTGTLGALEALTAPQTGGGQSSAQRAVDSMIGSFVPTGIAQIARSEGVQRLPQTALQSITSRIPGMQDETPVRLDIFGEPVEKAGGLLNTAINPLPVTTDRTTKDPIVAEMARVKAQVGAIGRKKGEDIAMYQYRQREAGKFVREDLTALMSSAEYQQADDDMKRQMINDTVEQARRDLSQYLKDNYGIGSGD